MHPHTAHVLAEARIDDLRREANHALITDIQLRPVFIPVAGPRLTQRLIQLVFGLVLFGVGIGLMLQSGLGVAPWDVLHQGLSLHFGL
ncbi:MAG: hypothetical protein V3U39_11940, partial [Acidimicrobiia bacterium]